MQRVEDIALAWPKVLLPKDGVDHSKWAVIACDQYTSEIEYWNDVENIVGDAPSTLRLIFPEVHLESGKDDEVLQGIEASMAKYEADAVLQETETSGTVVIKRTMASGAVHHGLLVSLDLEAYDFAKGAQPLIRPTEATIASRIPPRLKVREHMAVELPHIIVLIDDPEKTVIEPLFSEEALEGSRTIYDFSLMKGGGSISGQWISDAAKLGKISDALRGLGGKERFLGRYAVPSDRAESLKPLLFAVGDGNHSLATAKAYWEKQKAAGAGDDHPARFALVQLQNLHDPALEFEPIHRLLFNVKAEEFLADAAKWFSEQGEGALQKHKGKTLAEVPGHCVEYRSAGHTGVMELTTPSRVLPVASLTAFVDQWLAAHSEAKIDYVHGLEVIDRHVADTPDTVGLILPAMPKDDLFKTVVLDGVLPRKTFSMGEADEKRFYFEAKSIRA